jgi:hypothetical protein
VECGVDTNRLLCGRRGLAREAFDPGLGCRV